MTHETLQQAAAEHRKWVSPAATAFVAIRQHKDARSVLFRIAKSLVRWRFGNVESDILDFGDAGGVVVAGYLDPVAMRYLREGQVPLSWRKRAKKDDPKPEAPRGPSSAAQAYQEGRTAQEVKQMVADAVGQPTGDLDVEPPAFLAEQVLVHEETDAEPVAPPESKVVSLVHADEGGEWESSAVKAAREQAGIEGGAA